MWYNSRIFMMNKLFVNNWHMIKVGDIFWEIHITTYLTVILKKYLNLWTSFLPVYLYTNIVHMDILNLVHC